MIVNKTVTVEPLRDLDETTYLKVLKDKELENYENEIALSEGTLMIPNEIMELPSKAQYVLSFYNDKDWVNEESGKATYNNIVESYIASLEDSKWVNELYHEVVDKSYFNRETGDEEQTYKKVLNPEKKVQYMKLKQQAISYWNEHNLQQVIPIFKKLMLGGIKHEDMLKDAIIDDALYHDDIGYKMKNRTLAIKVLGMDRPKETAGANVWLVGGGKDFGKALAQFTNNPAHDISKYVGENEDE